MSATDFARKLLRCLRIDSAPVTMTRRRGSVGVAADQLEDRTLLTVNVGVVNTDASNLLQWELDNDDLAGGFGGGSEFSFDTV